MQSNRNASSRQEERREARLRGAGSRRVQTSAFSISLGGPPPPPPALPPPSEELEPKKAVVEERELENIQGASVTPNGKRRRLDSYHSTDDIDRPLRRTPSPTQRDLTPTQDDKENATPLPESLGNSPLQKSGPAVPPSVPRSAKKPAPDAPIFSPLVATQPDSPLAPEPSQNQNAEEIEVDGVEEMDMDMDLNHGQEEQEDQEERAPVQRRQSARIRAANEPVEEQPVVEDSEPTKSRRSARISDAKLPTVELPIVEKEKEKETEKEPEQEVKRRRSTRGKQKLAAEPRRSTRRSMVPKQPSDAEDNEGFKYEEEEEEEYVPPVIPPAAKQPKAKAKPKQQKKPVVKKEPKKPKQVASESGSEDEGVITLEINKVPTRCGGTNRVNAIDVISQSCLEMLETYQDKISQNWAINALTQYKELLSQRFFKLVDSIDANHAIQQAFKRAESTKAQLRNNLLDVKTERASLALEMQQIRDEYHKSVDHNTKLKQVGGFINDIKALRQMVQPEAEEQKVWVTDPMTRIAPMVNTHYGSLERLKQLNDRLAQLDRQIHY